jgi:hypothetical protein
MFNMPTVVPAQPEGVTRGGAMFRAFVLGFVVAIIAAGAAAYFALTSGVIPANADGGPLPLESWAAKTALRADLAREAPTGPNPVALTDANLIAGIGLYAKNCAVCHGTARGDASITPLAKGIRIGRSNTGFDGRRCRPGPARSTTTRSGPWPCF